MNLQNGHYQTTNGSEMWITGDSGGRSRVGFDWFDEPGACCDCKPEPYHEDGYLVWNCEICGGGKAKLIRVDEGMAHGE